MADDKQDKQEKQGKQEKQPQAPQKKEETSIIRISGKDIAGSYKIEKALNQVKGIGLNLASAIAIAAERHYKIDRNSRIGSLSDEQMAQLEEVIKNPGKEGIPPFMFNRRRDFDTNIDMHLVGSDLIVRTKQDIDADIRNQTWRGFRHQYRQKVRGQKTRSTGRTGETIGVMKKTVEAAEKAAKAAPAQQASKAAAPAAAPKAAEEKK